MKQKGNTAKPNTDKLKGSYTCLFHCKRRRGAKICLQTGWWLQTIEAKLGRVTLVLLEVIFLILASLKGFLGFIFICLLLKQMQVN